MTMLLKGIPDESYISYEKHAYRTDSAKGIIDIKNDDLSEAAALIGACRDKELEGEGGFHSYRFWIGSDGLELEFVVDEGKYHCDFSCPVDFYPLSADAFKSAYASTYLTDLSKMSADAPMTRFYCVDESATIIAEPVDLDENTKDENGVPVVKSNGDNSKLTMFFAAVVDDEDTQGG